MSALMYLHELSRLVQMMESLKFKDENIFRSILCQQAHLYFVLYLSPRYFAV